jgi:hypothetical protein
MLSYERERIARRQTQRRVRASGDRMTGTLVLDGGQVTSTGSETVYGMTAAQAAILVGGGFTALHSHSAAAGQRPVFRFDFGGEIGQQQSYSDIDVDLYLSATMARAGSIVGITVSVEQPSQVAGTEFQVYLRTGCSPPVWAHIPGCVVVLPEGACKVSAEFAVGTFSFGIEDEVSVGAIMQDAGMVKAQNGTVMMEVSWDV